MGQNSAVTVAAHRAHALVGHCQGQYRPVLLTTASHSQKPTLSRSGRALLVTHPLSLFLLSSGRWTP